MQFHWDNQSFILDAKNLSFTKDGSPLHLTIQEFRLLEYLVCQRGRLVSKEEIINYMEPDYDMSGLTNISKTLSPIKKCLKGSSCEIKNVPNQGYKFVGEIQKSEVVTHEPQEALTQGPIVRTANVPFVVGSVPTTQQFAGRKQELRRIFRRIENGELTAIVSEKGMGKTALLHFIATAHESDEWLTKQDSSQLERPDNFVWIHVDFRHEYLRQKEAFYQHVVSKLGVDKVETGNAAGDFEQAVRNHGLCKVFLLDHVEKAFEGESDLDNGFWEGLRACGSDPRVTIITCSRVQPNLLLKEHSYTSPVFNNFLIQHLRPFSDDELDEVFNFRTGLFDEADRKWIREQSKCIPSLVQRYCYAKWEAAEDGILDDSWRSIAE